MLPDNTLIKWTTAHYAAELLGLADADAFLLSDLVDAGVLEDATRDTYPEMYRLVRGVTLEHAKAVAKSLALTLTGSKSKAKEAMDRFVQRSLLKSMRPYVGLPVSTIATNAVVKQVERLALGAFGPGVTVTASPGDPGTINLTVTTSTVRIKADTE